MQRTIYAIDSISYIPKHTDKRLQEGHIAMLVGIQKQAETMAKTTGVTSSN